MSIRHLAQELYRAMKQVEALERELKEVAPEAAKRNELEQQLRGARAEVRRIRSLLEGAKAD